MFCKWCGKPIRTTDSVCPGCGRETPPLADCGGLYDLRHGSGPVADPLVLRSEHAQCPVTEKLEGKYTRDRKAARRHHTVTTALLLVTVCLLLVMLVGLIEMRVQLEKVEDIVSNRASAETTEPTQVPTDPTNSTEGSPETTAPPTPAKETPPKEKSDELVLQLSSGESWEHTVCEAIGPDGDYTMKTNAVSLTYALSDDEKLTLRVERTEKDVKIACWIESGSDKQHGTYIWEDTNKEAIPKKRISRKDDAEIYEWKDDVSPVRCEITFNEGTEREFTVIIENIERANDAGFGIG